MRIIAAIKSDIKFQFKHGFYSIYAVVSIIYLIVLSLLPKEYLKYVLPTLIYSDPSALGLFFIGGIIMLEKMQGIINYLVITPMTTKEYILSKTISLSILSVIVGVALSILSGYSGEVNYIILIIGIILTSMLFIFAGIIIVVDCKSLNQYFVKMVPIISILILPCFSLIGFKYSYLFTLIPSVAAYRIVLAAYNKISVAEVTLLMTFVAIMNYFLLLKVEKIFEDKIVYGGSL